MRDEPIYAQRGQLTDRNGELLAVNQPAYALALVREDCDDIDATLAQVSEWTGVDVEVYKKRYEQGRKRGVKSFDRLILAPDISPELLATIEGNAVFWPGLEIVVRPRRVYPQGRLTAHILGYVGDASEEELARDQGLDLGDIVGKQGLELVLEKKLRGAKGLRQLEVDATMRKLDDKMVSPPKAGKSIRLSIDLGLQRRAAELLRDQAGGIVVMEPFSGQVLALVTSPNYDNNEFAAGMSQTKWTSLNRNPRHPLQNRVIQSTYPPGSVWKLVVAACGLHHGFIDEHTTTFCPGHYNLGRFVWRCWKKGGHGTVDLKKSLVDSCDVYYYKLAERLGIDRIHKFAEECGFGSPTGVDLPHEKGGLVPSREWKRKRFGEPWHKGETINVGIGQGATLVQPLQAARFLAALLNGGHVLKPQLMAEEAPLVLGELPLEERHRLLLLDAMEATVQQGTAKSVKRPDARMGGKTGTAQVVKLGVERKKTHQMPYMDRDHAWLATWGEKDGKSYVVVVLVEHGGHGGSDAGPIARGVYDYLFGKAPHGAVVAAEPLDGAAD